MSSTYNDIRASIESRIAAEMARSPVYPVSYQNVPFTPPNNQPWVQAFIRFGDNSYATLLSPTPGMNRQNGTLVLNVYTPQGNGAAANFTIAERLKVLFDRVTVDGITFDAASGPAQVAAASPAPYYQTQVAITFDAYLD
jgi:hypothetical protein